MRRGVSKFRKLVKVGIFNIHRAKVSLCVSPRARHRGAIHVRRVLLEEDSHQFESGDLRMKRKSAARSQSETFLTIDFVKSARNGR